MSDLNSIIFSPLATPFWVFAGGLSTKLVDGVLGKRKTAVETDLSATTAHATLNKSLQTSFDVMSKELTRLRQEHREDCERYEARIKAMSEEQMAAAERYEARIRLLEDELIRMQMTVVEMTAQHGDPAYPGAPIQMAHHEVIETHLLIAPDATP